MTGRDWVRIASTKDVDSGEIVGLTVAGHELALCRVDDSYYCFDNICTHAHALLSDGWLEGMSVECPLHGGRFDIRTGEGLGSPIECALNTYHVRVANGDILIEVSKTGHVVR